MKHYDLFTGEPLSDEEERELEELERICPLLPKDRQVEEPEPLTPEDEAILASIWDELGEAR